MKTAYATQSDLTPKKSCLPSQWIYQICVYGDGKRRKTNIKLQGEYCQKHLLFAMNSSVVTVTKKKDAQRIVNA